MWSFNAGALEEVEGDFGACERIPQQLEEARQSARKKRLEVNRSQSCHPCKRESTCVSKQKTKPRAVNISF